MTFKKELDYIKECESNISGLDMPTPDPDRLYFNFRLRKAILPKKPKRFSSSIGSPPMTVDQT